MKVVFLHGIGDGDPRYLWLDGLNRGLTQLGHVPIEREQVIAPRYSSYLQTAGRSGSMPPVTYKPKDEAIEHREFERRQAHIQRKLQLQNGVRSYGFNVIPGVAWEMLAQLAVNNAPAMNLDQVRNYIRDDKVRADVLRHIIDHLPSYGEVILIGHSLGSVISIDLLDHLPDNLHVRRYITIGSPANIRALHQGSERLLKRFPYGHIDDWSNFMNAADIVTGGRGLGSAFRAAQDFLLTNVSGHPADVYLGDPAVAGLVADILYPSKDLVPSTSDIAVRMTEPEASVLLMQHFATAVGHNIKDDEKARRYRAALRIIRDDLAAQLFQHAATGHLVAPELLELMNGKLPELPHRWELHEAVSELVVLAMTNCVEPYEVDPGDAQMRALEDIAVAMGFRRKIGEEVARSINEVQRCVGPKGGVPWGRVLTAAAGVALLAAGPVGLAVAAPAGVFGAAAITGGLAAFGPGGMVGGLAMLGGLAGTGAATAAAAVAGGSSGPEGQKPNLQKLMMRVAVEHARKTLGVPFDTTLWYQLADFEGEVAAAVNRLAPFNDPKSPKLVQLNAAKVAVGELLRFMIEKGLSPAALTDGEPKAIAK